MKLIGVDVDALAKRLSELRQEQSDIEAILRIAKSGSPLLAEAIPKRYGEAGKHLAVYPAEQLPMHGRQMDGGGVKGTLGGITLQQKCRIRTVCAHRKGRGSGKVVYGEPKIHYVQS